MIGQDLVGTDVYLRHVRGEPAQAKRAADLLAAGKSAAEIEHLGLVVWLPFRVRAVYLTGLFRRVPRLILAGPDGRVFDWPLLGDYVRTWPPRPLQRTRRPYPRSRRMRPVNDVILVRPLPKETRTAGGIWLPDTAQERTNRATVVAIGPGVSDPDAAIGRRTPPAVREGQEVILSRYYGIQDLHTDGGEELETVRFGEIMAVVEPDPPADSPPPGVTRVSAPTPPDDEEVDLVQWPAGGPVTQR